MQSFYLVVSGLLVLLKVSLATECAYSDLINADCYGHDIVHLKLNLEQCKDACDKNCKCKSIHARLGNCWLKNYVCNDTELTNKGINHYAQFTKKNPLDVCKPVKCEYGKPINADCYGHDIKHFIGMDPTQCQAKCDKRCDCVSIHARYNHCWIKNHVCNDTELIRKGQKDYAEWNKGKCTY
ncbi:uncharacterized protein LOC135496022 [Lineus longissimus]|uniref:uncharacterized protein LOC135496022 n=1 Tax=Lineus longissimus TaxID=88925 RepID=UPI00315CABBF